MAAMYVSARRLNDPANGYIPGVRCFFKLLGLHAGQYWSPTEYMGWLEIQQKRFFTCRRKVKNAHVDQWAEFDHWLEDQVNQDSYIIYKPKWEMDFNSCKQGLSIDDRNYSIIWSAPLEPNQQVCSLVSEFNRRPPAAFPGNAISAGDVVVLIQHGFRYAWLVEAADFKPLFDFEKFKEDKENEQYA